MINGYKNIVNIGVNDYNLDLFEGQYIVPNGMAYNSYVILDDKAVVFDTVDKAHTEKWMANLACALNGMALDYIIVQHMEPDHSGSLFVALNTYPEAKIVASARAFGMITQFTGVTIAEDKKIVVKDGSSLCLGEHNLQFYTAPMVHWPEVIMTFDSTSGVLFSADAFGKFGATDADEAWACEARRYYFNIVGKYGVQVLAILKKLADLPVATICPLHGPVLTENLGYYLDLYTTWASYKPEARKVFIAYSSVYGNTKGAAELLYNTLKELEVPVAISDLARSDFAENVEDAFKCSHMVLASTTYDNGIFPIMEEFLMHIASKNYANRSVAIIENGTWAPMVGKLIKAKLDTMSNIEFVADTITIKSALTSANIDQIKKLAETLKASV